MDHLSGLDATFLHIETPETPMHVGGLNICEIPAGFRGDFFEAVQAHLKGRLHLASVFQRKLVPMPFELANPVWVHDDDLDLDYHIRRTVLPRPGSRAQLDRLVGRLHSSLLDRSRPLWEFYVIEGLQSPPGAPKGSRHVAFYSKVHHAALDGAGGAALAQAILDISPVPREVPPPAPRSAQDDAEPSLGALAKAGLRQTAGQYGKLVKMLPALAGTALQLLRPARDSAGEKTSRRTGNAWFGPKTVLNGNVTNQRLFAGLSLPLADLKAMARAHEATLNDVVLALCSGALRAYLDQHGGIPKEPLLAAVPVSLREAGNTTLNNQVSMMRMSLASTIADPLERLRAVRRGAKASKALTGSVKSVLPTDYPSLGAPWLVGGLATLFGRSRIANQMPPIANVAISNVPGPKLPLYLAGAKLLSYYPVSIAVHSMALNITVQSYGPSLDFGLTACRKAVPDLPWLAELIQQAFDELKALTPAAEMAEATPAPKKPRARKVAAAPAAATRKAPARRAKARQPA